MVRFRPVIAEIYLLLLLLLFCCCWCCWWWWWCCCFCCCFILETFHLKFGPNQISNRWNVAFVVVVVHVVVAMLLIIPQTYLPSLVKILSGTVEVVTTSWGWTRPSSAQTGTELDFISIKICFMALVVTNYHYISMSRNMPAIHQPFMDYF